MHNLYIERDYINVDFFAGGGADAVGAGEVSAASVGGVLAGICGSFRVGGRDIL